MATIYPYACPVPPQQFVSNYDNPGEYIATYVAPPPVSPGVPVIPGEPLPPVRCTTIPETVVTPPGTIVVTPPVEEVPFVCSVIRFEGTWQPNKNYYKDEKPVGAECPVTSLVVYDAALWLCVSSHTSTGGTVPKQGISADTVWTAFGEINRTRWLGDWTDGMMYYQNDLVRNPFNGVIYLSKSMAMANDNNEPGYGISWDSDWEVFSSANGSGGLPPADQSFFDELKNNVFDWMSNATVGDWLGALAVGAGVVVAGNAIVEAIVGDGGGDGQADSRFNGSPAYEGTITAPTLPVVVGSLMEFAGFAPSAYNVTLLPSTPLNFAISGNVNVRAVLNQLALAYQFDIITAGSVVKFVPKYQSTVRSLTSDDLGHIKDDTTGGVKYAAKRMQGIDLPRSVTIKYYSSAIDQNTFTQTSTLETFTEGQDATIEVPFTLTDAQAKTITETVLVNAHIEQQQYVFTTDYHNIDLEPSDVITIPLDSGGNTQVRIIEINETDDGLLEFTTTRSDYNSYSYVASGQAPTTPPAQPTQVATSIGYSDTLFLEVPPLNDNDGATPRIKALIHGYGRAGWAGADVYRSTDGGNSYSKLASGSALSTFGLCATAIPAPSNYRIWDTTTTISVKVKQGTLLTAASDLAVQNGANWCIVGQEVIGFVNATLTGTDGGLNVYSLSRLLRGRAGTEVHIGTHQANELFVILDNTLVDIPLTVADLGKTVKCKTVTYGSDISKVSAIDLQPFGLNLRPWQPAYLKAVRQPNNDWILTWTERPRTNNDLRDYTEISHDPDYAGFAYALYSGSTIKRKGTTTDQTFTYTAAMQVTDFGSVQATLNASVTQMSTLIGGGYPATITV